MNNKLSAAVYIIILFLLASCAGPWKGMIRDIETKEPLDGAVVLAVWLREFETPTGGATYFYEAKETLSDKEGKFEIPSYTPINLLPIISFMREPEFIIFKPGYGSLHMDVGQYLTGEVPKDFFTGEVATVKEFELSGKKYRLSPGLIELPKLKTREERRVGRPSPVGNEKDWKKQQELIKALREEWRYIYNEDPGNLYKIEEK